MSPRSSPMSPAFESQRWTVRLVVLASSAMDRKVCCLSVAVMGLNLCNVGTLSAVMSLRQRCVMSSLCPYGSHNNISYDICAIFNSQIQKSTKRGHYIGDETRACDGCERKAKLLLC